MAQSVTLTGNPFGAAIVKETAASHVPNNDVRAGATTVYIVKVDNSANGSAVYLKIFDNAAPTVGTTVPDYVLKVPGSASKDFVFDLDGTAFTNLSFAVVTGAALASVADPASSVVVRILCN